MTIEENKLIRRQERVKFCTGYVAFETSHGDLLVSNVDYPLVENHTWFCNRSVRGQLVPYTRVTNPKTKKRELIYPREIIHGKHKHFYYKNNDTLDLRRGNILFNDYPIAIRTTNNRRGNFPFFYHVGDKIHARLPVKKANVHLGLFTTEKDAAFAILDGIKKYYPSNAKGIIDGILYFFEFDAKEKFNGWGLNNYSK